MSIDVTPADLNSRFRENLRRRREQLGLTQGQVAAIIGAHTPYISDLETGKKVPIVGTLARLAEALQTTPAALLG